MVITRRIVKWVVTFQMLKWVTIRNTITCVITNQNVKRVVICRTVEWASTQTSTKRQVVRPQVTFFLKKQMLLTKKCVCVCLPEM